MSWTWRTRRGLGVVGALFTKLYPTGAGRNEAIVRLAPTLGELSACALQEQRLLFWKQICSHVTQASIPFAATAAGRSRPQTLSHTPSSATARNPEVAKRYSLAQCLRAESPLQIAALLDITLARMYQCSHGAIPGNNYRCPACDEVIAVRDKAGSRPAGNSVYM